MNTDMVEAVLANWSIMEIHVNDMTI